MIIMCTDAVRYLSNNFDEDDDDGNGNGRKRTVICFEGI